MEPEPCDGCGATECLDKHLCDVVMPTTPIAPKAFTAEGRRVWEQEMRDIYGEVAPPPLTESPAGDVRGRKVYTPDVEAQVYRLYITQRLTAKEVVERLPQLTEDGVHQMAMRRGWRKGQPLKFNEGVVRKVFELRDTGLSSGKIGLEVDLGRHQVEGILKGPRYRAMVGR